MSPSSDLDVDETRLIAVRRAIRKFGNPEVIDPAEASLIHAYMDALVSLGEMEEQATPENLEWYLDGIITGMAIHRLEHAGLSPEDTPKNQQEQAKQFQTGIDGSGNVRVNS